MTIESVAGIDSYHELKEFVHNRICEREQFDLNAFPMTCRQLFQAGKLCGFLFSIYGPRSVVCNAVFETRSNAIHFYNATGQRVLTSQLQCHGDSLLADSWRARASSE